MNSSIVETASGMFQKLKEMSQSLGLPSLEFIDALGNTVQMEIRSPSSLDFKIPNCEYQTHLMRLLVNKSLHFLLEVLGQSVTTGNFLPEKSAPVDPNLVENVLGSLNGGVIVCQGRGIVRLELREPSRRQEAVREALIDGNVITYPDYRYRSCDCELLVETQNGATQCSPCATPYDPCQRQILPNSLNLSDLNLDKIQGLDKDEGSKTGQQEDQVGPTIIEHHHHHHHHYYRDGASPVSFLYQDQNAPAPMSLTIE